MKYLQLVLLTSLCLGLSATSLGVDNDLLSYYVTDSQLSEMTDSQTKGLTIAIEQDLADKGWRDSTSNIVMALRNKEGRENIRELRVKALEIDSDGDKNLTIFDTPKDVRGTVFLTYSHILEDDEQWLFLPALKRVKRINSRNKSGPFMGSEFAFEDLVSFEVAKFDFNYLRDEILNEVDCHVVERFPKDKNSGYTKVVSWVDKKHKRIMKSVFYDRKEALLKTLEPSDYQLYLNKFWRAKTLQMTNHQTGKSTVLMSSNIQLDTGLGEEDFAKSSLRRTK